MFVFFFFVTSFIDHAPSFPVSATCCMRTAGIHRLGEKIESRLFPTGPIHGFLAITSFIILRSVLKLCGLTAAAQQRLGMLKAILLVATHGVRVWAAAALSPCAGTATALDRADLFGSSSERHALENVPAAREGSAGGRGEGNDTPLECHRRKFFSGSDEPRRRTGTEEVRRGQCLLP